jgi:diguanylate cyclase (GGDEF)-like protein/PAS domain S-box-containing protein
MKNIDSKKLKWFNQLFDSSHIGIIVADKNRKSILVNEQLCKMFGYEKREFINVSPELVHVDKKSYEDFGKKAFNLVRDGKPISLEYKFKKKDGTYLWARVSGDAIKGSHEVLWILVDITKRVELDFELQKREKQFLAINKLINLGHWEFDLETKTGKISDEMCRLLGLKNRNSITYEEYMSILHPNDREKVKNSLEILLSGGSTHGTYLRFVINDNGKEKTNHVYHKGMIVEDENNKIKITGASLDISNIKELEQELEEQKKLFEYQAHHDYLTGLPNRPFLMANLDHILKSAKRENKKVAIMFIDLDDFKLINDTLGHSQGDIFLKKISSLMKKNLRQSDILVRLGGDEFIVILDDIENENAVLEVVKKFLKISEKSILLQDKKNYAFMSIGISIYPSNGEDGETLISRADTAMYKAKSVYGKNTYLYYSEDISKDINKKADMSKSIMEAIENEEFVVYYQPQIDATNNKIVGVEALVRWQDLIHGLIPPNDFLYIVEELHMIKSLNIYVIKKAIEQFTEWKKDGRDMGTLALNMVNEQLECLECYDSLVQILKDNQCNPKWIEMEITEGSLIMKPNMAIKFLQDFKKLGVKIAIDDFGIGYSSLAYLKNLPIDKLKIDKSFIDNITEDSSDLAITKTIIDLANSLNLEVIAEGVETKEQKELLQKNGCSNIQGYYYSQPICAKDMEQFYDDFKSY